MAGQVEEERLGHRSVEGIQSRRFVVNGRNSPPRIANWQRSHITTLSGLLGLAEILAAGELLGGTRVGPFW